MCKQLQEPYYSGLLNLDKWSFLLRKASLFAWSLRVLFFKYLDFGRHFNTEVPTVNWMWLNSLEHWSWIGSGHMCQRVASQVILPPVPALMGFSFAVATTSGSLCKSHAFLLISECHQFPVWLEISMKIVAAIIGYPPCAMHFLGILRICIHQF